MLQTNAEIEVGAINTDKPQISLLLTVPMRHFCCGSLFLIVIGVSFGAVFILSVCQ